MGVNRSCSPSLFISLQCIYNSRHNYPAFDKAMHHMEPMNEFSLRQLKASTVIPAYVHDGSEEDFDTFEMKITDGKHTSKKLLVRV